jgi:hypothetical protein
MKKTIILFISCLILVGCTSIDPIHCESIECFIDNLRNCNSVNYESYSTFLAGIDVTSNPKHFIPLQVSILRSTDKDCLLNYIITGYSIPPIGNSSDYEIERNNMNCSIPIEVLRSPNFDSEVLFNLMENNRSSYCQGSYVDKIADTKIARNVFVFS